ncbi:thiamine-binding protein [Hazenella sp. IB182357]|uniref:Thiamine-binding protein n=1 Tax=Polycladospora coralii TaxID=2771432 RepID=A0A926N983_9BACL|nr:thiamine-binding protein [Polycladospora coralii]MBD1370790.1 thiamine-binding protein [Polycladospora coralii]MBS7529729.1 thiamine-binding protein [Polycladospora coralii]
MAQSLVSVQIIPQPANGEDPIPYINHAISVIQQAGVPYRVGPLETTIEGELAQLLQLIPEIKDQLVQIGCKKMLAQIKVCYDENGISMNQLTAKYDE